MPSSDQTYAGHTLDELEAMDGKRTQGTWESFGISVCSPSANNLSESDSVAHAWKPGDQRFIVAAVNSNRPLRERVTQLEAALREITSYGDGYSYPGMRSIARRALGEES